MSGPKNDSHLPEIERDKKIHESCPPRYNKNFISDLKKKQKEMKLQPHSNHRPTLDLQDKPLEHDPKEVAESSKFKLNIQETAAPEPGLRGIMCSFKINPGPHPHTTPSEKPDLRETARWQGVLTFRDAENPHHDLEDPSLDQSSRAARALPAPSPEFVDGGSGFVEIHMTWTEQILKSLRVFDEGLGLQQNRSYIPCIDIAYWGVFCFRMYGTPFLTSEESKGLSSERFRYKGKQFFYFFLP